MSSDSESTANSSSEESQATGSSSEHEITAIASVFQPYQDEPLAQAVAVGHVDNAEREHRGDEERDPDLLSPATLEERFEGRSTVERWCKCRLCNDSKLFGAREYRCCREVAEAYGKVVFEGLDLDCVVQHEDFKALTNKTVLLQVGPLLKDKEGRRYRRKKDQSENEYIRAIGYRWLARWLFGYMGWDNTRPLPACIYHYMRTKYGSGQAKGYAAANERP